MTTLCFIDTETTGLDPRIHQPYEVCWWRDDMDEPMVMRLHHSLEYADPQALRIGHYWERGNAPGIERALDALELRGFIEHLRGVTLVGSNPAFDAAMLTRFIGAPVWHHRMIDVAQAAMWVLNLDRPIGLADVRERLNVLHDYDIPEPDHTAEGDVRTTRAVYEALREIRGAQ